MAEYVKPTLVKEEKIAAAQNVAASGTFTSVSKLAGGYSKVYVAVKGNAAHNFDIAIGFESEDGAYKADEYTKTGSSVTTLTANGTIVLGKYYVKIINKDAVSAHTYDVYVRLEP
jgi:hypothetical protein